MKLLLSLALVTRTADALTAGSTLTKALKANKRPVVVHLYDPQPAALDDYAVADVSEACRKAGAAAVLVTPSLVRHVADEQAAHKGSFPCVAKGGPLSFGVACRLLAGPLLTQEWMVRDSFTGVRYRSSPTAHSTI
jgi:hypothetical protein